MTTTEPPLIPPPPMGAAGEPLHMPPELASLRLDAPTITRAELVGLGVAGLLGNYALRTAVASVAAVLAIWMVGALLLLSGRIDRRESRVLVVAAMALAPWLAIRSSTGLTWVTVLAIAGLFALGVGYSTRGRFLGARVLELTAHAGAQAYEWIFGSLMIRRFVSGRARTEHLLPIVRGIVVAIPVVGVFALLLASADEVFRSVISVNALPTVVGHVVLAGFLAVVALGLLSRAAHETAPTNVRLGRVLRPVEVKVVLGSVAALFAGFVVTQIVVAAGGVDHVLETTGLTQAEHARRGFFQLLWVAGLTLALIGGVRSVRVTEQAGDTPSRDRFRPLAVTILVLTLVITAISIQRLVFYVDAFGFTPLRLWSLATAGWIGLLVLVYALSLLHPASGSHRDGEQGPGVPTSWFPAIVVLSAGLFVFGLNVLNPDGFVTSYNVDQAASTELDIDALGHLSPDNIGSVEAALGDLSPVDADRLVDTVCARSLAEHRYGFLGWNAAKGAQRDFWNEYCG